MREVKAPRRKLHLREAAGFFRWLSEKQSVSMSTLQQVHRMLHGVDRSWKAGARVLGVTQAQEQSCGAFAISGTKSANRRAHS